MGDVPGLSLPPDGRIQCQHVVAYEPYCGENESRHSESVTNGELSRGLAREVCRMQAGNLESDLRSGVARADHQNGPFLELRWAAVLAGMQLHDARTKFVGDGGYLRDLTGARCDDDAFRFETPAAGRQDVAVILPGETVHLNAGLNRQIESSRVRFEVVGHLVLRGK